MKKEEIPKINYDLSVLTLEELITVYKNIDEFIQFLCENKIEEEKADE